MSKYLEDPMFIRQLIMDHYQYPRNHQLHDDPRYRTMHMAADSCIDDIKVQIKMDGERISDVCFDGEACTISTASTSMMTELMKNKTKAEALALIREYYDMIEAKPFDPESMQEAVAFKNVGKQANRVGCATIGWRALEALLKEDNHE